MKLTFSQGVEAHLTVAAKIMQREFGQFFSAIIAAVITDFFSAVMCAGIADRVISAVEVLLELLIEIIAIGIALSGRERIALRTAGCLSVSQLDLVLYAGAVICKQVIAVEIGDDQFDGTACVMQIVSDGVFTGTAGGQLTEGIGLGIEIILCQLTPVLRCAERK